MDVSAFARIARSAGIDAPLTGCEPLGEGVKALVHRLDFEGRDSLALKVFALPDVIDRELAGYRAIGNRIPEIPELVASGDGSPAAPFGWLLLTLAPGQQFDRLIGWMPKPEIHDVLGQLGELLARLHAIECASWSVLAGSRDGFQSNADYMADRFEVSLGRFRDRGGEDELAGRLAAWFAAQRPRLEGCRVPVVCHGDLHLENIFIDPGPDPRLRRVIDLEASQAADPVLDLARAWHHASWMGDEALAALLAGYGEVPTWFDEVFDVYMTFFDLKLWNFYATDPQSTATESIAARLSRKVGE